MENRIDFHLYNSLTNKTDILVDHIFFNLNSLNYK